MGPVGRRSATTSTIRGLRLDTDYNPYFSIQGRGQTVIIVRPYEEFHERLRPQDFCFYGYALYCPPTTLGNQDYHEHTSGASFQTGYFKKVTLTAGYYWGQGVNFEALPPAPRRFLRPTIILFWRAKIRLRPD